MSDKNWDKILAELNELRNEIKHVREEQAETRRLLAVSIGVQSISKKVSTLTKDIQDSKEELVKVIKKETERSTAENLVYAAGISVSVAAISILAQRLFPQSMPFFVVLEYTIGMFIVGCLLILMPNIFSFFRCRRDRT